MSPARDENERAIFIISVAAELAGVHPQTLRVYERKGLVLPSRTSGNTRRYSQRDIERLRRIQELTNEGINLAGVLRIIELEREIEELRTIIEGREHMALVPLRDVRRARRALKSDRIDEATKRRTFQAPPASS
ncbi:MAG: MerR family transcriptional regulator, heat shock protein HspR [Actinomycetota bacterium]|nr:MerR family transcriptional regulator, heat shock protein HspR [Actinomycetota bacterium]